MMKEAPDKGLGKRFYAKSSGSQTATISWSYQSSAYALDIIKIYTTYALSLTVFP